MTDRSTAITALMQALLAPLPRLCLTHQVRFSALVGTLRNLLISQAVKTLTGSGHKTTASRIALMTGIPRRDVGSRIKDEDLGLTASKSTNPGLVAAIVGRWQHHSAFLDKKKNPKPLTFGFAASEFNQLVDGVNRDLNPATVLFELERVGAVEKITDSEKGLEKKRVTLRVSSFVPRGDPTRIFNILGEDVTDLSEAVSQNVLDDTQIPNLHARTHFDKIRSDKETELREWLLTEGHAFHARVREKLAQLDQDLNPDPHYSGPTLTVTVGAFSLIRKEHEV